MLLFFSLFIRFFLLVRKPEWCFPTWPCFDMPDDFVHRTHETVCSNKTVVTWPMLCTFLTNIYRTWCAIPKYIKHIQNVIWWIISGKYIPHLAQNPERPAQQIKVCRLAGFLHHTMMAPLFLGCIFCIHNIKRETTVDRYCFEICCQDTKNEIIRRL